MYCRNCGKEMEQGAKWCSYCGKRQQEDSRAQQSENDRNISKEKKGLGDDHTLTDQAHKAADSQSGEDHLQSTTDYTRKCTAGETLEAEYRKPLKRVSFWKYLIFSALTFGIYGIYTLYHLAKDMNVICEGDGKDSPNYFVVLLLSVVTCGVYGFYWFYMQAQRLYEAGDGYGVEIREKGFTILLWQTVGTLLFGIGPVVGIYKLFRNRNQIADRYNRGVKNLQLNRAEKVKMGIVAKVFCMLGVVGFAGGIILLMWISMMSTKLISDGSFYEDMELYNTEKMDNSGTDGIYTEEQYIDMVRNACYQGYQDITYGDALEGFCTSSEWDYVAAENGDGYVIFTGEIEEGTHVTVEFLMDLAQGQFYVQSIYSEDANEVLSDEEIVQFLNNIFEIRRAEEEMDAEIYSSGSVEQTDETLDLTDIGGFAQWEAEGFPGQVRTDIKIPYPLENQDVNNCAVFIGLGTANVGIIIQEDEAAISEWEWFEQAEPVGDTVYFQATLEYTGQRVGEKEYPLFVVKDAVAY